MNPTLIDRTTSAPGLWLVLYLYTFQIFLDFSGYSDVAIGLGRLYGITLPENFDRPYLQPNIQQFWQRWHMTLSGWFRAYYFLPLSRALIRRHLSPNLIVFVAQLSTMFLIGMWHGVTVNFALWGLWHGIGLFLFKLLADHTRGWTMRVNERPWLHRFVYAGSVFATFHFVALGWVFFALPRPEDSLNMLARLFGG
jgi:D-alanyl-lipoteichoic acid acyltransferase DltB (MBOAT superfamily)